MPQSRREAPVSRVGGALFHAQHAPSPNSSARERTQFVLQHPSSHNVVVLAAHLTPQDRRSFLFTTLSSHSIQHGRQPTGGSGSLRFHVSVSRDAHPLLTEGWRAPSGSL
eukprot:2572116-Prymnesium_polylepis.2